ncbi:hypothetical protein Dimus_004002 [Dionaea muscipula]
MTLVVMAFAKFNSPKEASFVNQSRSIAQSLKLRFARSASSRWEREYGCKSWQPESPRGSCHQEPPHRPSTGPRMSHQSQAGGCSAQGSISGCCCIFRCTDGGMSPRSSFLLCSAQVADRPRRGKLDHIDVSDGSMTSARFTDLRNPRISDVCGILVANRDATAAATLTAEAYAAANDEDAPEFLLEASHGDRDSIVISGSSQGPLDLVNGVQVYAGFVSVSVSVEGKIRRQRIPPVDHTSFAASSHSPPPVTMVE